MNHKIIIATVTGLGLLAVVVSLYITPSQTGMEDVVSTEPEPAVTHNPGGVEITAMKTSLQPSQAKTDDYSAEDYQYVQDRLDIMRARRPDVTYNADDVAAALARQDAWSPSPVTPTDLPLQPEELTDGREFIDFDSLKLETLVPGDSVKLAIGDTGQQYDVNIDDVQQQDESRITWKGHIEGYDGEKYHVSFTKGETLTVGGIDTPDGHYVVQAHGNKGWVASSGLLFKEHVDPIVPPEEELETESTGHVH